MQILCPCAMVFGGTQQFAVPPPPATIDDMHVGCACCLQDLRREWLEKGGNFGRQVHVMVDQGWQPQQEAVRKVAQPPRLSVSPGWKVKKPWETVHICSHSGSLCFGGRLL